jgi:hypothetical protein
MSQPTIDPNETITIPVPRVLPLGWEIRDTAVVQDVWDAFVKPAQEAGEMQSGEMRCLMAILRAVYAGLEGDRG